jgi:hypothetical protein
MRTLCRSKSFLVNCQCSGYLSAIFARCSAIDVFPEDAPNHGTGTGAVTGLDVSVILTY